MGMVEKRVYFFAFIFVLISLSFVSAALSDFFKITGKVSSQPTNVSVSFKDKYPCEIVYVSPIANVNPLEGTLTTVNFSLMVYNFDKEYDMNFSSVFANFSFGGETRGQVQCVNTQNITKRDYNFSCSVDMWYWDSPGAWSVNTVCSDIGNGTLAYNTSTTFTYNQLKAMLTAPEALTWPVLEIGAENQTSNNDPSTINNTGNYNGTIEVTAYDLLGQDDPTEIIAASNFTSGLLTGALEECIEPTSADRLLNNSAVTITNSIPNPGNLSINDGSGQEELYYCIPVVPNVTSQTYSTNASNLAWLIAYGV